MRRLISLAVALMPVTSALAADATGIPTSVYAQNTDDRSSITASCDAPVAGQLTCHFTEMTVWKPDEKEAETRIAKGVGDMLKAPASEFKDCGKFGAMAEAIETGKAPADVADKQKFESDWVKEAPEAKGDTIRLMKAFVSFCKSHDSASADAVARAVEQLESTTCKIRNFTFDRTFTLNYSTKRWQSTVQNTDECGTIDYSELSKPSGNTDSDLFWNYTTKTIVTNPTGKNLLGGSCAAVDQMEHAYTWQVGKFYANCRYVELSP